VTEGFDQAKFDSVLNEYMKWTSRTLEEALNSKAYMIARKALWFTKKADREDIKSSLRRLGLSSRGTESPRGALIINAARAKQGLPGLHGRAMAEAINALEAARLRSIGFLKSGWIPAIRILEGFAKDKGGAAPRDSAARVYGQEKGAAYPATADKLSAVIVNSVGTQGRDRNNVLERIGGPALDLAFYDEANSMQDYIEKKMNEDALKANESL